MLDLTGVCEWPNKIHFSFTAFLLLAQNIFHADGAWREVKKFPVSFIL